MVQLATDLGAFVAAADYRFDGVLSPAEATSWRQALAWLGGEIAGVDLHAWPANRRVWRAPSEASRAPWVSLLWRTNERQLL